MDQRLLGRTGVHVRPLCLGAMMFGPWGDNDRADATRIIHRALDAGINLIDTADVYSAGESEEILGEATLIELAVAFVLHVTSRRRTEWKGMN